MYIISNHSFSCGSALSFVGTLQSVLLCSVLYPLAARGSCHELRCHEHTNMSFASCVLEERIALCGICLGVEGMRMFPTVIAIFMLLLAMYENYIWENLVFSILFVLCLCKKKSHYYKERYSICM